MGVVGRRAEAAAAGWGGGNGHGRSGAHHRGGAMQTHTNSLGVTP